jgi:hypothetical protein
LTDINIIAINWPVFMKLTMDAIPLEIFHVIKTSYGCCVNLWVGTNITPFLYGFEIFKKWAIIIKVTLL